LDSGIKAEDLIYYGLEYKFVTQYIVGELSFDEMKEKLSIAIHQFAKKTDDVVPGDGKARYKN
jgi:tRNA dimethylallyltransferase